MVHYDFSHEPPKLTLNEYIVHGQYGRGSKGVYATGINPDITGANRETVWNVGGAYAFMPAAAVLDLVSTSVADDVGSTGALTVGIKYLDSSFVEHNIVLEMNGQTVVETPADIFRINDFRVITVGTGLVAAGTITLKTHTTGAVTYAQIDAGATRSRQLVYTVPDGYELVFTAFSWCSSGAASKSYLKFTLMGNYNDDTGVVNGVYYPLMEVAVQNGGIVYSNNTPVIIPEHCNLYMSVIGDAATLTCEASASWRGYLLPNE